MEVMLANKYKGQDPSGWWVSEKLDGIRAIWDGEKLYSRNGLIFYAPKWFTNKLPKNIILDGELWEDHGLFQTTAGKVRSLSGNWSNMKYMIFDVVSNHPFEDRLIQLSKIFFPSHCKLINQILCQNKKHLFLLEKEILNKGGEGVMLRMPNSLYEHKISKKLLKLKRFKSDEAIVIGYEPGEGKYKGMMGALVCKRKGKKFKIGVGFTNKVRTSPPSIGSKVTFRYFEETLSGIPRFPTFVTIRNYE